jgi:hypothetical protein
MSAFWHHENFVFGGFLTPNFIHFLTLKLSANKKNRNIAPMFIYDNTTIAFIQKSETFVREILHEIGIVVKNSRFVFNDYLFPINVVVFEGHEWGHFNPTFMQLSLNRKLIYLAKDSVVRDILKHELAHYLTYILYQDVRPHGPEFHSVCERFGFPKEVSKATLNLEEGNLAKEGDLESEKILEKVKKLLSLAQSSNSHEAELATLKANDLLLRHNLDYLKDRQEPIYMDRLLMRKRKDSKLSAIYSILKHFIVRPVISQGTNACCLEVSGSLTNVKLAGYIAHFLDQELDYLWEQVRSTHDLKGIQAKNSFWLGVAEGFDRKMKLAKMNYSEADRNALIVVEKKLDFETQIIYKRLAQSRSAHQKDAKANQLGHSKGMNLTIRNAVEGEGKKLYLTHQ